MKLAAIGYGPEQGDAVDVAAVRRSARSTAERRQAGGCRPMECRARRPLALRHGAGRSSDRPAHRRVGYQRAANACRLRRVGARRCAGLVAASIAPGVDL